MATYNGADKRLQYLFSHLGDGANMSGTAQPTGTAVDNTLYIQYDANDGTVVALWVYLNGTWTEVETAGGNLYGTDEPTDEADEGALYIQYDSTDYSVTALWAYIGAGWREIQLGGGGGASGGARYTETVLWSGTQTTTGTITLSDSVKNYDLIMVIWSPNSNTAVYHKTDIIRVSDIDYSTASQFMFDAMAVDGSYFVLSLCHLSSANELTVDEVYNSRYYSFHLLKVIGIKWEIQETALIYSEEEREVGVWTDGKTLYQITLVQSGTVTLSNTAWTTITFSNTIPSDIEYCHATEVTTDTVFDGRIRIQYSNGVFQGASSQSGGQIVSGMYLTIQYTKTTDTAGSGTYITTGGYAHHYSTTEHVVGTWIDGKPIYECTYEFGSAVSVPSGDGWGNTGVPIGDMKQVLSCWLYSSNGTGSPSSASIDHTTVYIKDIFHGTYVGMILQYTKTTD